MSRITTRILSTSASSLLHPLRMWVLTSVGTSSPEAHTFYATVYKVFFCPLYSHAPSGGAFSHVLSLTVAPKFYSMPAYPDRHPSTLPGAGA